MELDIPDCLPQDSWFRDWMAIWPTAESSKSFLLFSAMAMLGACLGRRVWLDQDIHQVRPMINLLLIGPSGIGKSSAVKIAKRLLPFVSEMERPQFFEGGSTKEKLHEDLAVQPKAIIFASELAAFFSKEKYKENLIPYVTQLLDYEDVIELRSKSGGIVPVHYPAVSILGASTLEWLQDQLPDSAVSGGFLARFLILNEEAKGQRVATSVFLDLPQRLRNFACSRTLANVLFEHAQNQIIKCRRKIRFDTPHGGWHLRSDRMQVTNHRFGFEWMMSRCEFVKNNAERKNI